MGSMDRNTVIGFVLLAVLLFLYLFLSTKSSQELQKQKLLQADSIARVQRVQDSLRIVADTTSAISRDTLNLSTPVNEEFVTVENDVFRIRFSNKGGQPDIVEL